MSGNPAFQNYGNAFQPTAFQAGVIMVAGTYWVGSPAFATPGPLGTNYHFTAAAYSVASPSFATPVLQRFASISALHANAYSLGALAWIPPTLSQRRVFHANSYSLASPSFVKPTWTENYRLFSNAWAVGSPVFSSPRYIDHYRLTVSSLSLGPIAWSPVGPIRQVNVLTTAPYYWLGSPSFNYPYLRWQIVMLDLPPTYLSQIQQATDILVGTLNTLLGSIPPAPTKERDTVRILINTLRSNAEAAIRGNTLGTQLQAIFNACLPAGATFAGVDATRQYLMSQAGNTDTFAQIVFRSALIMTLALESQILATISFTTQSDVINTIRYMSDAFDAAKIVGIDEVDVTVYQTLNAMAGALINHLARTELQLPRYMTYISGMPMPSLYLANRIYADEVSSIDARSQEIERENRVVHPAFCPRAIRVLSTVVPGIATR